MQTFRGFLSLLGKGIDERKTRKLFGYKNWKMAEHINWCSVIFCIILNDCLLLLHP